MKRTTAPYSNAGKFVDRNVSEGTTGTKGIAEDKNNAQEEICSVIEGLGLTLDGALQNQLYKAVVGLSHVVAETFTMETEDTPGAWFPAVPRNIDTDVTATQCPLLVAKLRAVKAKVLGFNDFSCTVSGSTITLTDTPANNKLINLLQADYLVSGWLNGGQAANIVADFSTTSTQRCINIAGTDYAITGVTTVSRQIVVSGTPASGAQTASVYTYRIAGSTSARLHKIAGFVGVAAGDIDGEVVGGWRKMDREQGHRHANLPQIGAGGATGVGPNTYITGSSNPIVGDPTTDTVNGPPRTGKTTDPRTNGQYVYTWAGIYNAA